MQCHTPVMLYPCQREAGICRNLYNHCCSAQLPPPHKYSVSIGHCSAGQPTEHIYKYWAPANLVSESRRSGSSCLLQPLGPAVPKYSRICIWLHDAIWLIWVWAPLLLTSLHWIGLGLTPQWQARFANSVTASGCPCMQIATPSPQLAPVDMECFVQPLQTLQERSKHLHSLTTNTDSQVCVSSDIFSNFKCSCYSLIQKFTIKHNGQPEPTLEQHVS